MPKPFVAKTNIEVYKKFYESSPKKLQAFYRNFDYKYNTAYRLRKALLPIQDGSGGYIIKHGFHAYIAEPAYNDGGIVIKCLIPKGAKYFFGDRDEIVSTSIVLPTIKGNFPRHIKNKKKKLK